MRRIIFAFFCLTLFSVSVYGGGINAKVEAQMQSGYYFVDEYSGMVISAGGSAITVIKPESISIDCEPWDALCLGEIWLQFTRYCGSGYEIHQLIIDNPDTAIDGFIITCSNGGLTSHRVVLGIEDSCLPIRKTIPRLCPDSSLR